jgi:hypothetical protein
MTNRLRSRLITFGSHMCSTSIGFTVLLAIFRASCPNNHAYPSLSKFTGCLEAKFTVSAGMNATISVFMLITSSHSCNLNEKYVLLI